MRCRTSLTAIWELVGEAHEAIRGSTWAEIKGVSHFPMSENPEVFIEYQLPILVNIRI